MNVKQIVNRAFMQIGDTSQEQYTPCLLYTSARPVKSVKPEKPFNDGYRYVDDSEGETSAWGV